MFCRTRTEVDMLTETMNGRGYRAEALHGGMDQAQRDRVMGRLRDGTAELLIATDVAARGLDVDTLTHVVNFDVPSAPDSYVHRIGRVGRAGREGVAITLAEPRERRLLDNIEKATKQRIAIEPVPSVAELRARQAELTAGTRARGAGGRQPRRLRRAARVAGERWRSALDRPRRPQARPRGQRGDGRGAGDPDGRRSSGQAARGSARARLATGATSRWTTPARQRSHRVRADQPRPPRRRQAGRPRRGDRQRGRADRRRHRSDPDQRELVDRRRAGLVRRASGVGDVQRRRARQDRRSAALRRAARRRPLVARPPRQARQ